MAYIGSRPDNVVSRQSSKTYRYTATAGQTVFSGADQDNQILAITPSDAEVHMNGLMLDPTDYTLTGTSVTLSTAASAGDELTVTGFQTFEVADTYTKTAADDRYVNTTGDTMTGNLTIEGDTLGSTFANAAYGNGVRVEQTSYSADNYVSLIEAPYIANYSSAGAHVRIGAKFNGGGSSLAMGTSNAYGSGITNTALEIDSAGHVTMPYQPAFRVGLSQGNSQDSSNPYTPTGVIVWDQVHVNRGSYYSSSNGRFTAPVAGCYCFHMSALLATGSTGSGGIAFVLNGTILDAPVPYTYATGDYMWLSGSIVVNVNANDWVGVQNYGGHALHINAPTSNEHNSFSGYLIG